MSKQINPTRMELQRLRKQLETTTRGHKLLKDKQDELIHSFIPIINEYKALRIDFEAAIRLVLNYYRLATVTMTKTMVSNEISATKHDFKLNLGYSKLMGVDLPELKLTEQTLELNYDLVLTNSAFDTLILKLQTLLLDLINLATIETKVNILIKEIEKSKRRVNAIENIVIKEIVEQIKDIRMRLADLELSNTIRMMKSKEIIIEKYLNKKDD
ncbi:MAG TPA: V-type ATP synthase subunit D [Bacilli bacterium]|nr:V-type ATP synthase subunit D [Bacilli bacterium]